MKSGRILKSTAVVGAAALILGAFVAGPADAKKKKKKKPPVVACAPYTPYEPAAAAPIAVVTDAATQEAPVTVTLATAEGLGTSTPETEDSPESFVSHAWHNVQIDTAAADTALFVRLEFAGHQDYDLFLRNPDGSSDVYSAGGPPYHSAFGSGTGNGGHAEGSPTAASENIDGAVVTDCQGFSVDVVSATSAGGDVTLKYWLGAPPAV